MILDVHPGSRYRRFLKYRVLTMNVDMDVDPEGRLVTGTAGPGSETILKIS